jgi:hypothetical protein
MVDMGHEYGHFISTKMKKQFDGERILISANSAGTITKKGALEAYLMVKHTGMVE